MILGDEGLGFLGGLFPERNGNPVPTHFPQHMTMSIASLMQLQIVSHLKPTTPCSSFKFNDIKYCIEIYWRQSSVDDNCVYVIDAVNYF